MCWLVDVSLSFLKISYVDLFIFFFDKVGKFKWAKCCKLSIVWFLVKYLDRFLLDFCGLFDKNLVWILVGLEGLVVGWIIIYILVYW